MKRAAVRPAPGAPRRGGRVAALLALVLLLLPRPAPALTDGASGLTLQATAGYGGYARLGHWLPVVVDLSNTGPDRSLVVEVQPAESPSGAVGPQPQQPYRTRYRQAVTLPRNAHKRFTMHVPVSSPTNQVALQVWEQDQAVTSATVAITVLGPQQVLVGIVGDAPGPLPGLAAAPLPSVHGVQHPSAAPLVTTDLPVQPDELGAFDALVLEQATTQALSAAQRQALQGWVAGGGVLVLSGGPQWPSIAAGLPADLLPLSGARVQTVANLEALASFGGPAGPPSGPVAITQGVVRGRTLAAQDGAALLAVTPYGTGSVLFSAADLGAEPLLRWTGAPALWSRLLTMALPSSALLGSATGAPVYYDPKTSMAGALASVPEATSPSWPLLAALLALYLALAAPISFLLLRRLRRSGLNWLVLPALAIGFAAASYGIAFAERGSAAVVNTITVTELPPGATVGRVSTFVGLFAPAEQAYHVRFAGGGMLAGLASPAYKRFPGPQGAPTPVPPPGLDVDEGGEEADLLPMAQWTARGVASEHWVASDRPVEAHLSVDSQGIHGTLTNRAGTLLQDCAIASPWGADQLGSLAPGASVQVRLARNRLLTPMVQYPIYAGNLGASPPQQIRLGQLRQQIMNAAGAAAYAGSSGGTLLGPVQFVAWTGPASPPPVIDGRSVAQSGLGLLLVGLPLDPGSVRVLPPGLLPARLTTVEGAATLQGNSLALTGATLTLLAPLPEGATAGSITLVVALPGQGGTQGQGLQVAAFNNRAGRYDLLPAQRVTAAPPATPTPLVARLLPTPTAQAKGKAPTPAPTATAPAGAGALALAAQVAAKGYGTVYLEATLGPGDLTPYLGDDGAVRLRVSAPAGTTIMAMPVTYGYSLEDGAP